MIRGYLFLLQMLGVTLFGLFFSSDVTVKLDVPGQINAGTEIKVEITINKGALNGFSRFQLDLPPGLTATNISSANADFSFKDQKVRYIWLRLPEDPSITISFNIKCYERLKGNFDLSGKFSYIDNNERKNIDIQPHAVAIIPFPSIDPNLLVDIKDYGKIELPQLGTSSGEVACIRQKPVWSGVNREYMVNVLVRKESLKKFAKIEEIIPAGYTAVNVDSKEGIFTFKDNRVKFLWMNLPADPYFTVSYKLIPAKGTSKLQMPVMSGLFSYIVEDKTQSISIMEKDVSLANLTPEKVKEISQEQGQTIIASTNPTTTNPITSTTITEANTNTNTAIAVNQTVVKQTEVKKVSPQNTITQTIKTNSSDVETADLLEPQSGIYYRVQLAAGHKPVNIKSYFRKYKLDNTIFKEQHNGWIKYSVGSFNMYKDAHDYRIHIWNTTSITDAFVAAYNSGKRITVQEALMVATQRWVK